MTKEGIIGAIIALEIVVNAFTLIANAGNLSFFNPIRNYEEWYKLNIFGVALFTILLHIILMPLAIWYWFYKSITVGRKKDE